MENDKTIETIPKTFEGELKGDLLVTNSGPRGMDAARIAAEIAALANRAQNGHKSSRKRRNGESQTAYVRGARHASPNFYA